MSIEELVKKIEDTIHDMFRSEVALYAGIAEMVPYINTYLSEFVNLIPDLNAIGMDLHPETVLNQAQRFSQALENRDCVMIYDCLYHEVRDTLAAYAEIKSIMNEG